MKILKDYPLRQLNTFHIDVKADWFVELSHADEIQRFLDENIRNFENYLVMGGGSNMLFLNDYKGVVIKINNKGIQVSPGTGREVIVSAGAGESWDDLVKYCVEAGYGGIENLSMIPGCVGAAPVQNIGAYGVEVKDVFYKLDAVEISSGKPEQFLINDCRFSYRNSIFKSEYKDKYIIYSVSLRLFSNSMPRTDYGSVRQELEKRGGLETSILDVRDAICNIRRTKLPDPKVMGNAGSFFKNPTVTGEMLSDLRALYQGIIAYPQPDNTYKLAAGWLIEQCGWKGKRKGDAGVHDQQALVIVNYGMATGMEILDLSIQVQNSVREHFNVDLEREVNVIDSCKRLSY